MFRNPKHPTARERRRLHRAIRRALKAQARQTRADWERRQAEHLASVADGSFFQRKPVDGPYATEQDLIMAGRTR